MHPDDLSRRVMTTAELHERGATPNQIGRMIAHRCLVRITQGVYACVDRCPRQSHRRILADSPVARLQSPEQSFGARGVALGRRLGPDVVLTGAAVAALHGLPVIGAPGLPVDTRHGGPKARNRSGYRSVPGLPPPDQFTAGISFGLATLPFALADMAALSAGHVALAALDAALARGVSARSVLEQAEMLPRGGGRHASTLVDLADPRSESPGESWARWLFHVNRLPMPELQATIVDAQGRFIARVDALWREARLVFEFDGRVKYRGDGAGDAVFQEKIREDRLRAEGFTIVRAIWADLYAFDRVVAQLTARLTTAA